jgi:arginyl-tRNA synthetase
MKEKELIIKALKKVFAKNKINLKDEEIESLIETPPSQEMGDFAFPCFVLAKSLKKNPKDIAIKIREDIDETGFEDVQTSGAYLNFFVNRKKFSWQLIKQILEEKENFGSSDIGKGKKALIEHTSINPNASPHVGRARNAIIGDSIVKILNFLNYKTEVHYYVNNVSKQIAMLVLGKADKLKFEAMLKKYMDISKKVEKSEELEKKVFDLLYQFEKGEKSVVKSFNKITQICVNGQEKILSDLGIHYDYFDYESSYLEKTKDILSMLEKTKKLFKDEAGRLVLNQKGTSVENKMKTPFLVLTRNDGTGLYPLRDIAYTVDKMQIAPEKNIVVLGEDQKLYFQQISEALKLLGFSSPEVIHYSFILLREKAKAKKMSTRKGDVVLLEDFIGEAISKAKKEIAKRKTKGDAKKIGVSAVKYAILKNSANKSILFNLADALNFEGDTGPYILYTYARASSILKKAKKKLSENLEINKIEDKEIELVKKLSQFPEVVLDAYNNYNPSMIANYSYQLAQIFNEFYHSCPVINSNNESFRLSLVEAFRYVLKNSLNLLGIETIEKM